MPTRDDSRNDRAARLAAQLRANLKRRKEQARNLADPLPASDRAATPRDG